MFSRKRKIKRDWSRKRYGNPFFKERRPTGLSYGRNVDWQTRFLSAASILAIAGLVWLFFFSRVFAIKAVEVNGNDKINREELEQLIWQQVDNERRFLVGPQKNLFLFDRDKLLGNLKDKYVFDDLSVEKSWWRRKITLNLKEKSYSLIWSETGRYRFLNLDGTIISEIDAAQVGERELPLVENTGEAAIIDKRVENQTEKISFIVSLFGKLKSLQPPIKAEKFQVASVEDSSVKVIASGSPIIIFSAKNTADGQLERLSALINTKLKDDFKKKKRIDLRFNDKIFWE